MHSDYLIIYYSNNGFITTLIIISISLIYNSSVFINSVITAIRYRFRLRICKYCFLYYNHFNINITFDDILYMLSIWWQFFFPIIHYIAQRLLQIYSLFSFFNNILSLVQIYYAFVNLAVIFINLIISNRYFYFFILFPISH